jgi:hypothetical protein
MGAKAVADFSGYATKAGLVCSDGRTITPEAFKHQDGTRVPLVWQHASGEPTNVLGHAILEARADGVYAYAYFNGTPAAVHAKELVEHGDINALSIFANRLKEKMKSVTHGMIREVSLVLAGANPGALIDNVSIAHGDDIDVLDDEAFIYTGLTLEHEDKSEEEVVEHADDSTLEEIYDTLNEEQKKLVHYMVGVAAGGADDSAEHSDDNPDDDQSEGDTQDGTSKTEDSLNHKEGEIMNVFEKNKKDGVVDGGDERHFISHDDMQGIVRDALGRKVTLSEAVSDYALAHGIENIDTLFPDAKAVQDRPEWIKRQTEWVAGVINGTKHTPFSRIKTMTADLTHEDARAKGYIKGTLKKEQFFAIFKRVTTPKTIYKKQVLDRDDMIDITDFDIVAWLKVEMRFMLEEELARAILIGDGRDPADEDKIDEQNIRPIAKDDELYVTTVTINIDDANSDYEEVVEALLRARKFYKGSGNPTFYTTETVLTEMLLTKDGFERRRYPTVAELASALRVSAVVPVEVFEDETDLLGIIVNLTDYTVGADKGGEVNLFDDFDIDYNQYKYLIETRVSGALTKVKSALVVRRSEAGSTLIVPTSPTFNEVTGVVTIPTVAGVTYKNDDTNATLAAGVQAALAAGATLNVRADTDATKHFATDAEDQWSFTRLPA